MSAKTAKYQKGTFLVVPNAQAVTKMRGANINTYLALCLHADAQGICYPAIPTMAVIVGYTERQVQRSLGELVKLRLVKVIKRYRKDGSQTSNGYQLLLQIGGDAGVTGPDDVEVSPINSTNINSMSPTGASPVSSAPIDFDGSEERSDDQNQGHPAPPEQTPDAITISKLYYDVTRKYNLPVTNHNNVRKKIAALEKESGFEIATGYLRALLQFDLREMEGEFKPTLNEALDIYSKRVKIVEFLKKNQTKRYWKPEDEAPERPLGE